MTIQVKNVLQNKKLQMKAEMEFNLVSLVQLWDKCEDAKSYLTRLSCKVSDSRYSSKWSKLSTKSLDNIMALSEEVTNLLHHLGAFDALKRSTGRVTDKALAYTHTYGHAQRASAKSTR